MHFYGKGSGKNLLNITNLGKNLLNITNLFRNAFYRRKKLRRYADNNDFSTGFAPSLIMKHE